MILPGPRGGREGGGEREVAWLEVGRNQLATPVLLSRGPLVALLWSSRGPLVLGVCSCPSVGSGLHPPSVRLDPGGLELGKAAHSSDIDGCDACQVTRLGSAGPAAEAARNY